MANLISVQSMLLLALCLVTIADWVLAPALWLYRDGWISKRTARQYLKTAGWLRRIAIRLLLRARTDLRQ